MYSADSGASWATVAQNIHPPGVNDYTANDFVWLVVVIIMMSLHIMCTLIVLGVNLA